MTNAVILDTQLLVLLVAGATSPNIIRKHRRLTQFTVADFDLLASTIGESGLLFVPNIVSEASNLLRQHREPELRRLSARFAEIVGFSEERYVASRDVVEREEHARLGVTDTAIIQLGEASHGMILTSDLDLYLAAIRKGLAVTNFNHKREEYGTV